MSSLVVEVQDLQVQYGKGNNLFQAVKGISFEINAGECVGFIGANGAGKSSTLKTLMGFIHPMAGSVKLFGESTSSPKSRARCGYLPEVAQYYPFMKARELLELYGGLSGLSGTELKDKIPAMLEEVGLSGKSEILLSQFSKGMQQRLGIAQALIAQPELLILDELASGLDPLGRHDLRVLLEKRKAEGCTIFFSSHELTEIETLCDRILLIHQGEIVRDAPLEEIRAESGKQSLESYYIRIIQELS